MHRQVARRLGRHQSAARLHQQQRRARAYTGKAFLQPRQIARDHRLEAGVHHRGGGALVFLRLGQDAVADAGLDFRREALDDFGDDLLMGGVGVAVQQRHGDGLDALVEQAPDGRLRLFRIERRLDLAVMRHALCDRAAQIARNQRRRFLPRDVVKARHAQIADLQDVAEAFGGDQPGLRDLAFDDGVGSDRGAVAQLGNIFARERALGNQPGESLDDGAGIVVHGGGDLAGQQPAVRVEADDVGKGAADIDSEAPAGFSVFHMSSLSSRFTGGPVAAFREGHASPQPPRTQKHCSRGAIARIRSLSSLTAA